ncbi:cell wall metabolism sensor histidine kinase WalK [Microbacterium sp. NIBRBAC000506063]|uniref:cell wall metabolism sensor histidine kinase WalK n=1 Tax=Microbacterium sp. NIBRBAC000506063 TaxID=2734618 RepID=UPI001CB6F700|nr:cell wall metabolism sensor histidine kinase WalK [Microbacterium sp. NIBRBAC000506063]
MGASLNVLLDHVESSLASRQRKEEQMRRFVADASHELRTPLASIRGYSELSLRAMEGAASDPETTRTALERIQAQSLRMTRLVEDLLLLARLDEGRSWSTARSTSADSPWSPSRMRSPPDGITTGSSRCPRSR